jgi:hypothetical protein
MVTLLGTCGELPFMLELVAVRSVAPAADALAGIAATADVVRGPRAKAPYPGG